MLHPFNGPSAAPSLAIGRWIRGLQHTEVLGDLASGGPYTFVAPIDEAFDRLPWSFDRLLDDKRLVEPCVDLFEYTVICGAFTADGPLRRVRTLHGESIHLGERVVIGPGNTGRIVASLLVDGFTVHATERCVLPTAVLSASGVAGHRAARSRRAS